jgi:hypothetical protein
MKRFFALAALLLFLGAPVALAGDPPEQHHGMSSTTVPPGDVLD